MRRAITDPKRARALLLSADLLGVTKAISDRVCARLAKDLGLPRAAINVLRNLAPEPAPAAPAPTPSPAQATAEPPLSQPPPSQPAPAPAEPEPADLVDPFLKLLDKLVR